MIDKNTLEIRQDEDKTVYTSLEEIADDLPDHSPRYVLLSYPLTMVRNHCVFRDRTEMLMSQTRAMVDFLFHTYSSTTCL